MSVAHVKVIADLVRVILSRYSLDNANGYEFSRMVFMQRDEPGRIVAGQSHAPATLRGGQCYFLTVADNFRQRYMVNARAHIEFVEIVYVDRLFHTDAGEIFRRIGKSSAI